MANGSVLPSTSTSKLVGDNVHDRYGTVALHRPLFACLIIQGPRDQEDVEGTAADVRAGRAVDARAVAEQVAMRIRCTVCGESNVEADHPVVCQRRHLVLARHAVMVAILP